MKKIYLKRVCSALALTAVVASTASMTSFAAVDASPYLEASRNGFTQDEIDASAVKPVVRVTNEILSVDYAKANKERTVTISIEGANLKYASSGLHLYYDSRLKLGTTPVGSPAAEAGAAIKYLTLGTPRLDPTASEQGMSGVFVCSAGDNDYGQDGDMYLLSFTLPDDVAEGDVFPFDIFYKSVPAAEDLFTNSADNTEGKLMQGYFFTRSINNGITSSYNAANETFVDETGATVTGADAIAKCAALADLDPSTDGVIAIVGAPDVTTTTAPVTTTAAPVTTTTAAPITTTTAAPVTTTTAAPVTTTAVPVSTTAAPAASTTAAPAASTTAAPAASTTAKPATTTKPAATTTAKTTAGKNDSPKTGVAGVGVAVAGLAVAIGTAFVLRKKED